jgi:hypothetical protein
MNSLATHAWLKREPSSVTEFGFKLSMCAEKDVTLDAPVIRQISGRVLDHAYANRPKVTGLPVGFACLARVLSSRNRVPVCRSEGDVLHVHGACRY